MRRPFPTRRRLRRGVQLLGQWAGYLARSSDRATAFHDLRTWIATTLLGRDLTELDLPWFTLPATRFLEHRLQPERRAFEWGSGASTVFLARRGLNVFSVEHDPAWYEAVSRQLIGVPEVELCLVETKRASGAEAGGYPGYAERIDTFPDGSFDLIVIDGRRRGACLEHALPKLGADGMIVFDDSERARYRPFLKALAVSWEKLHFEGPRPASIWPAFARTTVIRHRPRKLERTGRER